MNTRGIWLGALLAGCVPVGGARPDAAPADEPAEVSEDAHPRADGLFDGAGDAGPAARADAPEHTPLDASERSDAADAASSAPAGDASDAAPSEDAPTEPPCSALAEPPADLFVARSGSRLRAEWYVGSDGTRFFYGWYDTTLRSPCAFVAVGPDEGMCLPRGTVPTRVDTYVDASCTTPALNESGFVLREPERPGPSGYYFDELSCAPLVTAADLSATARTLYLRDERGACVELGPANFGVVAGYRPSTLRGYVRARRLSRGLTADAGGWGWAACDGSWSPEGFTARAAGDAPCTLFGDANPRHCNPSVKTYYTSFFSDGACRDEVAELPRRDYCGGAAPVLSRRGGALFAAGAALPNDAPLFQLGAGGVCERVAAPRDARTVRVRLGAGVLGGWPRIELARVPLGARLEGVVARAGEGTPGLVQPYGPWRDRALDTGCGLGAQGVTTGCAEPGLCLREACLPGTLGLRLGSHEEPCAPTLTALTNEQATQLLERGGTYETRYLEPRVFELGPVGFELYRITTDEVPAQRTFHSVWAGGCRAQTDAPPRRFRVERQTTLDALVRFTLVRD